MRFSHYFLLLKLGFLDPGSESEDLLPGTKVQLPLWYIKELKLNNPYFNIQMPPIYKSVHKAVCEAETTHIELGKLNNYFYEYGRYLTPYDTSHIVGTIVFETLRQRVRYLLDISKGKSNSSTNGSISALVRPTDIDASEHRLDDIESKLYMAGLRTSTLVSEIIDYKLIFGFIFYSVIRIFRFISFLSVYKLVTNEI